MYDTIVFDLGGVLIDWNPRYLYRKIFATEAEVDYFLQHVCTSEWNEQQDGGRPLAHATDLLLQEFPDFEVPIRAFYGRWEEMLGGPIHETVAILETLHDRQQMRLLALTNWSAETFPIAWERYAFLQLFSDILVSGRENLKKPDPRIFHLLFNRFGIDPDKAIFIDDNKYNIRAAEELGMTVVHYQSPTQLHGWLQRKGLL
ncbi:MAG: HAD family phosphatase [Lewinellaceae bacterium]|nr:HAD family phosphatase [Lewinellaceae bacterium]